MNNSFERLIDGTCATLRAEVLPRIDDEYARSQVWGVINLLNTLRVRADWSAGFLQQQLDAQRRALVEAAQALRGTPGLPDDLPAAVPQVPSAAGLLAARDQGNRLIGRLLEWLDGPASGVEPAARAAAEAALLGAMRAEVEIELKHSPRPLFAQMSGAADG